MKLQAFERGVKTRQGAPKVAPLLEEYGAVISVVFADCVKTITSNLTSLERW